MTSVEVPMVEMTLRTLLCIVGLVCPLFGENLSLRYAEQFSAQRGNGYWELSLKSSSGEIEQKWKVHDASSSSKKGPGELKAPLRRVVTLSTTNLPYMKALGVLESLKAVDAFKHVNTPEVREAISKKSIVSVGAFQNLDVEKVVSLNVDAVFTYSLGNSSFDTDGSLEKVGQNVFFLNAYLESTYLARAEWIKFFGILYGKLEEANEIFNQIEARYQKVLSEIGDIKKKPSVFCNRPFRGIWYLPGGESTTSHLISDAGGKYLWSDVKQKKAIQLDVEAVLSQALDADVWLVSGHRTWRYLEDIPTSNAAYRNFKAWQQGRVYANDKRLNDSGGNDIFESALLEPDVLLKDYIKMFHPELLPNHVLKYHRQIFSKSKKQP